MSQFHNLLVHFELWTGYDFDYIPFVLRYSYPLLEGVEVTKFGHFVFLGEESIEFVELEYLIHSRIYQ